MAGVMNELVWGEDDSPTANCAKTANPRREQTTTFVYSQLPLHQFEP
jgi:hypothetical protein